jgi:hypothetical protein
MVVSCLMYYTDTCSYTFRDQELNQTLTVQLPCKNSALGFLTESVYFLKF